MCLVALTVNHMERRGSGMMVTEACLLRVHSATCIIYGRSVLLGMFRFGFICKSHSTNFYAIVVVRMK